MFPCRRSELYGLGCAAQIRQIKRNFFALDTLDYKCMLLIRATACRLIRKPHVGRAFETKWAVENDALAGFSGAHSLNLPFLALFWLISLPSGSSKLPVQGAIVLKCSFRGIFVWKLMCGMIFLLLLLPRFRGRTERSLAVSAQTPDWI